MSVQKYKYYIGNEDNNELGMVISDIMNKAFNGVDTMTIKILTSPYRIDAANLLLNQPLWKERQSDSYIEFRGFITEVDTTETDKYNLTLQVKASTKILADLDSEITTEVLGRRKITSVEAAFIGDDSDDYEDFSNGYVASDHAVLIIPGNDPAFNNEVAEAVSATGGSSTSGVVANVNDGDAATGYKVTKGGVAALWGQIDGSSATIKASVVGARVRITCITALGTTQDHTATLQYYNNDTLAWVNIGDSFEVKKDETWGRLTWTAEITISGYVDTNEILDGADDWKIRLLVASAGTPGHSLKIRTITVDIYSDAKYNGASFPISSYSGDDTGMNVSVNPVTAGVETNDSYVVGQKDRDALISIFGLFSASDLKGMTIDVDANFSGYTARSFAGTNLIDVLEYFSDKQQAHWWFDHHNNIIAIYKESTLATDPTLREPTESDFSSYGYQKKVDQQVKSVTVKGATYKVGDQDNIDVEYKFPQIHDIPIPTTSLKNLILDKP
ncbi:MAG: hypothetical protein KAS32_21830, partial [Candidatus Peribacteraceae bacterium]|nr:hypothetical protein [Candidatus Peribacteraceae bacterium]